MADNILRLTVNSSEYDAKLKKAAEGIRHLAEVAHKSGGELTGLEKAELDYVKALGSMETKSRTAAGSVRELESSYKELKVIYDQLNEIEKADEGGKALAASLEQLKQRAQEARAQLDTASKSLNDNGQEAQQSSSLLDVLASKFTVNIDALKLFNVGLQAAEGVLSIAKDAFFSSESNIDEWGRTVEGAKGAYDVFLQTINGGNWNDFFTNLSTAVQGARDLYDALDRLGSVKSNNQAAIAIQQQLVAQLRLMKQQGQNVDAQLKAATERLAQLQSQAVNAGKGAGHETIINSLRNGINGANTTGVNISDGTLAGVAGAIENRGQQVFDNYKRQYESLTKQGLETVQKYDSLTKSYYDAQVFNLENLSKEDQKRYLIARAVTERETDIQKGISIYAQAVNEGAAAAREQFKGNRYALQGTGNTGTKNTSTGGKTKQQQAEDKVTEALLDYNQTIEKANLELKSGAATEADVKKKQLSAQERLYDAYGDAYNMYHDPKYKEAQDKAAEEIVKLGGEVKASAEAQKKAQEAARALETAQNKLADAQLKLAEAQESGDLKQIYSAEKNVQNAQKGVDLAQANLDSLSQSITVEVLPKWAESALNALPQEIKDKLSGKTDVPIPLTMANLDAFIANTKEQIASSDLGSGVVAKLQESLSDATAIAEIMTIALKNGIDTADFSTVGLMQKLLNHEDISDETIQSYVDTIVAKLKEKYDETEWPKVLIKFDINSKEISNITNGLKNDSNKLAASWSAAASAISAVGNVMNSIEDPAVKVMGTIAQAIASIALGASQAIAQAGNGSAGGPWGWIAFAAAATATMISTIASVHNATGYAQGGIVDGRNGGFVGGMSYSGDNVGNVRLNSGELVLNHAQQNNLANELEGETKLDNLRLTTEISGEDIRFVLAANNQIHGLGDTIEFGII